MHQKHPLWLRCTHWINVPVLTMMVWSGLLIYWANDIYPGFFPQWFYERFDLEARLAEGMGVHFLVAWFFVLNGALYITGFLLSGHWREVIPNLQACRDLWPTILHDIGLREKAPLQGRFNAAQRFAYSGAIVLGVLATLSGFAIYKPVQLGWLTSLFLGYEGARLAHFIAMLGLVAFTFLHLLQVIRAGWQNLGTMVGPRWSYGLLLLWMGFFAGAFSWAYRQEDKGGTPAPFRAGFEFNGALWNQLYRPHRSAACTAKPPKLRENGDLGLESAIDLKSWRMEVASESQASRLFTQEQIRALPRSEATVELRCIEGWSTAVSYAGVKFSDFMKAAGIDSSKFQYVGFVTPDGEYYVSIDMESMQHPETMLTYEINGHEITLKEGAPLRLFIPIKYGIKSIKRIGKVIFSNKRPPDYWAERGYDWYSGL